MLLTREWRYYQDKRESYAILQLEKHYEILSLFPPVTALQFFFHNLYHYRTRRTNEPFIRTPASQIFIKFSRYLCDSRLPRTSLLHDTRLYKSRIFNNGPVTTLGGLIVAIAALADVRYHSPMRARYLNQERVARRQGWRVLPRAVAPGGVL